MLSSDLCRMMIMMMMVMTMMMMQVLVEDVSFFVVGLGYRESQL